MPHQFQATAPKVRAGSAVVEVVTRPAPPTSKTELLHRAQLVARLRHPNLVRMLPLPGGAGLTPVPGNARRLADFIVPTQTFRRFETSRVLCLLLDVLSGLRALHELKLDGAEPFVHGDVSPRHIYVDEHGTGRLVPLVSIHLLPKARLESTGYIAPERLLGERIDARADVYSVGVMLWEALAGRPLFPDTDPDAVLARALSGQIPRLAPSSREPWTRPLCAIAERAIAANPAQRFGSALELSQAITRAAGHRLTALREGSWQDEAPTPVFMPRVHLVPTASRSATPPATVVELPPPAPILSYEEVRERTKLLRAAWLGLASVGLAALGWLVPHVARLARTPPAVVATPVSAPAAAATPRPASSITTTTGSSLPVRPVITPEPAPSASAAPAPSARPRPARAPVPRPRAPRPTPRGEADYGI